MKITNYIFLLLFIIVGLFSCSKEEPPSPLQNQIIDDSLFSQYVNYDFPMEIYLPAEYETNKNLPIVYLLEGVKVAQSTGEKFIDVVVGTMNNVGLKAILVAVGDRSGVERELDFLAPGCLGSEQGFSNYYNFVTKELIPYIDNNYSNDHSRRTLIGHSHGGNFVNNLLFREDPNNILFYGYISVDPSECDFSTWEEGVNKMNLPNDAIVKLHISEARYNLEPLNDLFKAKNFPWLFIDFVKYPDEDHVSVARPSIRKGLKFIYGI